MITQLTRNWWIVVLRGVLAILFGVVAFVWPAISIAALVLLFGAYALVDGIFAVIAALTNTAGMQRWWVLLEGVVGIVIGVLTFFWPGVTAFVLLYFIAAWSIVTGVLEILAAIELRKAITNEWLLIVSGILSVLFGLLVVLYPSAGALSVIWIIALYAVVFGILLIMLGLRLRNWNSTQPGATTIGRTV
jgi:uncharacterized membrane protein HdeD (DUF308 family)